MCGIIGYIGHRKHTVYWCKDFTVCNTEAMTAQVLLW